jgi:hypothetical protein
LPTNCSSQHAAMYLSAYCTASQPELLPLGRETIR